MKTGEVKFQSFFTKELAKPQPHTRNADNQLLGKQSWNPLKPIVPMQKMFFLEEVKMLPQGIRVSQRDLCRALIPLDITFRRFLHLMCFRSLLRDLKSPAGILLTLLEPEFPKLSKEILPSSLFYLITVQVISDLRDRHTIFIGQNLFQYR